MESNDYQDVVALIKQERNIKQAQEKRTMTLSKLASRMAMAGCYSNRI